MGLRPLFPRDEHLLPVDDVQAAGQLVDGRRHLRARKGVNGGRRVGSRRRHVPDTRGKMVAVEHESLGQRGLAARQGQVGAVRPVDERTAVLRAPVEAEVRPLAVVRQHVVRHAGTTSPAA